MPESRDAMQDRMTQGMEKEEAEFYRNLLKLIEDWETKNKVWITGVWYKKTSSDQKMSLDLNLKLPRGE